jgi:serine/threonine protein kinase
MSLQGSEEKSVAFVTPEFIRSSLRAEDHGRLDSHPVFEDSLGGGTYLDWIAKSAKRMFLILNEIGAPHRIFNIIDQAFDDDDLPLSLDEIARLELSNGGRTPQLDAAFSRTQLHLFSTPEGPQPESGGTKPLKLAIEVLSSSSDLIDTVRLASNKGKIFTRVRVVFGNSLMSTRKENFLQDVEFIKKSRQQHIISLKTAYLSGDSGCVLVTPTLNTSLRDFSSNLPKFFRFLPPDKQHETLLNWPHCLACALLFLHKQGLHHGKIVPSNVLVDPLSRIYLGFSVFTPSIRCQKKEDDFESYNYSPPERWTRTHLTYFDPVQPPQTRALKYFGLFNKKTSHSSSESDNSSETHSLISIASSRNYSRPYTVKSSFNSPPTWPSAPTTARVYLEPYPLPEEDEIASPCNSDYSNFSSATFGAPPPYTTHASISDQDSEVLPLTQPQATDQRCGDIFSLACITADILAFLVKGEQSSFSPRKKKSRIIRDESDASFHGNPAAVLNYLEILEEAARNKPQPIFSGIEPILMLVKRMLTNNPHSRPKAKEVVRSMEDAMVKFSKLPYLHCGGGGQC